MMGVRITYALNNLQTLLSANNSNVHTKQCHFWQSVFNVFNKNGTVKQIWIWIISLHVSFNVLLILIQAPTLLVSIGSPSKVCIHITIFMSSETFQYPRKKKKIIPWTYLDHRYLFLTNSKYTLDNKFINVWYVWRLWHVGECENDGRRSWLGVSSISHSISLTPRSVINFMNILSGVAWDLVLEP